MFELIGEFIIYWLVEVIFFGTLTIVQWIGIAILKVLTFSKVSLQELKFKYKDSSIPYFIGFAFLIGIIYLLIRVFS